MQVGGRFHKECSQFHSLFLPKRCETIFEATGPFNHTELKPTKIYVENVINRLHAKLRLGSGARYQPNSFCYKWVGALSKIQSSGP